MSVTCTRASVSPSERDSTRNRTEPEMEGGSGGGGTYMPSLSSGAEADAPTGEEEGQSVTSEQDDREEEGPFYT